jgi:hypothetical protein
VLGRGGGRGEGERREVWGNGRGERAEFERRERSVREGGREGVIFIF